MKAMMRIPLLDPLYQTLDTFSSGDLVETEGGGVVWLKIEGGAVRLFNPRDPGYVCHEFADDAWLSKGSFKARRLPSQTQITLEQQEKPR